MCCYVRMCEEFSELCSPFHCFRVCIQSLSTSGSLALCSLLSLFPSLTVCFPLLISLSVYPFSFINSSHPLGEHAVQACKHGAHSLVSFRSDVSVSILLAPPHCFLPSLLTYSPHSVLPVSRGLRLQSMCCSTN